mmetsp:Transcript_24363/g.63612  ORF Transcript_24363/g.63612 Transcript_24363/m.63612 type:complete len:219 (-) Transcript_24363:279-935(-)
MRKPSRSILRISMTASSSLLTADISWWAPLLAAGAEVAVVGTLSSRPIQALRGSSWANTLSVVLTTPLSGAEGPVVVPSLASKCSARLGSSATKLKVVLGLPSAAAAAGRGVLPVSMLAGAVGALVSVGCVTGASVPTSAAADASADAGSDEPPSLSPAAGAPVMSPALRWRSTAKGFAFSAAAPLGLLPPPTWAMSPEVDSPTRLATAKPTAGFERS